MKISILLPYKENFSSNYAGAVSLFVKDTVKNSKYKKNTFVYGNTDYKNKLLKNYVNLNLNKTFYQSGSKLYVESFLKHEQKKPSNLIEIHNRPNYVKFLKDSSDAKLTLFFHNDPLSMNGSKTLNERIYLVKNIDQLIFNSSWSKNRFFIGMKDFYISPSKISIAYQSASKAKINLKKNKILYLL